ncbi:hypothetical protein HDU96_008309 [Phlyctochytrium bullatum]|nr:hypothetical protein HDU96_008309 [Phlyctochytrium bullatum]
MPAPPYSYSPISEPKPYSPQSTGTFLSEPIPPRRFSSTYMSDLSSKPQPSLPIEAHQQPLRYSPLPSLLVEAQQQPSRYSPMQRAPSPSVSMRSTNTAIYNPQSSQPQHMTFQANSSTFLAAPQPGTGVTTFAPLTLQPGANPFAGLTGPVLVLPAGAAGNAEPIYLQAVPISAPVNRWQHLPAPIAELLPGDLEPSRTEIPSDGTYTPQLVPLPTPADRVVGYGDEGALVERLEPWMGRYAEVVERIRGIVPAEQELKKQEDAIATFTRQLSAAQDNLTAIRKFINTKQAQVSTFSFKSSKVRKQEQAELEASKESQRVQVQVIADLNASLAQATSERDLIKQHVHHEELKDLRKELITILNQAFANAPTSQAERLHSNLQNSQSSLRQADADLRANLLAAKHLREAVDLLRAARKKLDQAMEKEAWAETAALVSTASAIASVASVAMEGGGWFVVGIDDDRGAGAEEYRASRKLVGEAAARIAAACIAVPKCAKFFWSREELATPVEILVQSTFKNSFTRVRDLLHFKHMKAEEAAHERHLFQALSWLQAAERGIEAGLDTCVAVSIAWRRTVTAYRVAGMGKGRGAAGTKGEDVEWLLPGSGVVDGMAVGGTVTLLSKN